jgi:prepilin-type N-terminal cleavage/methylation domain-containing protein
MTRQLHSRRARGFTLIEILVSTVLLAIIGAAMTRMLIAESRQFEINQARKDARAVGRNSMNILFSDLRMAQDGASAPGTVLVATSDSLKIRLPYAFGLVCDVGSMTTVSMLSADSSVQAAATYAGLAWRSRLTNQYTYVPVATNPLPVVSSTPTTCTGTARVRSDTIKGRSWAPLDIMPAAVGAQPGAPAFLYQEVTYWFGASTAFPSRIGLWRQATGGTAEELVAPFDASARFKFYQRSSDTPTLTPPTPLDSLVGVAIVLNGASVSNIPGHAPIKTAMETSVFFRNRKDP